MNIFERQLEELKKLRDVSEVTAIDIPNGSKLVVVSEYQLPEGWQVPGSPDRKVAILFLAPPGYPSAQPDCFWLKPTGVRLFGGRTPQNSNDSNPIPGYTEPPPHGTWFSWHLQQWNPNVDSLVTYFGVIKNRLHPPR